MFNWWQTLLMRRRLNFVMIIMTGLIVFQLLVLIGSISIFKSIRTLVAGEGHWSKAQKSSLMALTNYAASGDQKDLDEFHKFSNVLLADKTARLELPKKDANYQLMFDSLVAGQNHPEDVKFIIIFLRLAYNTEMVQDVLREWEAGDATYDKVIHLAHSLENQIKASGPLKLKDFQALLIKLNSFNDELTIAQTNFSTILLVAARASEQFLTISLLLIVLSTFTVGYFISLSLIKTFNSSMKAIKFSIGQAVAGNYDALLSLKHYEDIGDLSLELNRLFLSLKEQMLGRLTAEVSEARLSLLADAMPQIVSIRNKEGKIEFLNKRGWDFLGFELKNPRDLKIKNYIHPDDVFEASKSFNVSKTDNKTIVSEFRLRNFEGGYTWFLSRSVPVLDKNGNVVRWYGSLTDIEAQKHANLQLLKAIEMRDQFLSIASHELKTPLTSYKLQLQIRKRYLEKKDYSKFSPEKLNKMVSDDERQVNRLVRLVDDMLDISRIRSGKMELECSVFDLRELLLDVVSRISPQFIAQNCQVIVNDASEVIGKWDRHKIEQVIINLLTNALKYGNSKDVEISLFFKENLVSLHVKDYGIGICKEDQMRIFELFERVLNPKSVTGLGLGLFIVKQIVDAHHGKISIESEIENGSTFIVELPYTTCL